MNQMLCKSLADAFLDSIMMGILPGFLQEESTKGSFLLRFEILFFELLSFILGYKI